MEENTKKIWIVIPAYNEEAKIGQVIDSLKLAGFYNIFVVNDGSRDRTEERAFQAGADVLNHVINRGQGAALRTGIEYLRETHDPDIVVTFDADGQHKAEDIGNMVMPIIKNEADIVLGSRFLTKSSQVPLLRKIILKAGIFFTNIISNVNLTDTHNGFRALNKRAINLIRITHRGMEHASEIIEEIKKRKLRYKEVPVEIIYSEYSQRKGQKTSNFIKVGIKMVLKKLEII